METTLTLTKEELSTLLAGLEHMVRETRSKKHMLGTSGCAEAVAKLEKLAKKLETTVSTLSLKP